jgi:hypothetical protein
LQNLIWICTAVDALQNIGAKFCMSYMDDLVLDDTWNVNTGMLYLQQKVRPYLKQFDGCNFLDWSKKNNFAIGQIGNHPLEAAHRAAADYFLNHNLV